MTSRRRFLKGLALFSGLAVIGPVCLLEDRPKLFPVPAPTPPPAFSIPPGHYIGTITEVSVNSNGTYSMGYRIAADNGGWIPLDGRLVPKMQYPALYSVIGARFGDEPTAFKLPDFTSRPARA